MSTSTSILKALRVTHLYVGVFIAPALLFFAFTGAAQTFSFHETTKGSSYKPPQIMVILGQIHKKQTPVVKQPAPPAPKRAEKAAKDAEPPTAAAPVPAPPPAPQQTHNPWPLKWFFLLVAVGLFTSTFSGIYMSYKYNSNKALVTLLLIAGTVIPILMVVL